MPRGTPQTALRAPRGKIRLAEVMKVAMRASKIGIRTAIPCTVQTYDPAQQKATVVAGHIMVINTDAGGREGEPMIVPSCPVRWPATQAGYLTFPLVPGDTGHLVASDRSLEQWMLKAPVVDAVDPAARHTHNIIDGIFEPGLHPTTAPITPPTALDGTVLEGTPFIKLGAAALPVVNALAKNQGLVAAIDAMLSAGVGAGGPGAANFSAATTTWNSLKASFATTKVIGE